MDPDTRMIAASKSDKELGLGINTVHDLDLHNLKYFKQNIPWIDEVSIGHVTYLRCPLFGF